jgi:hypothetical protein
MSEASTAFIKLEASNGIRQVRQFQSGPNFRKPGGLLSSLAALPLVFGIPVLVLALCSTAAALTLASSTRDAETGS